MSDARESGSESLREKHGHGGEMPTGAKSSDRPPSSRPEGRRRRSGSAPRHPDSSCRPARPPRRRLYAALTGRSATAGDPGPRSPGRGEAEGAASRCGAQAAPQATRPPPLCEPPRRSWAGEAASSARRPRRRSPRPRTNGRNRSIPEAANHRRPPRRRYPVTKRDDAVRETNVGVANMDVGIGPAGVMSKGARAGQREDLRGCLL